MKTFTTKKICMMSIMVAMLVVVDCALAIIPNVELVTPLVIVIGMTLNPFETIILTCIYSLLNILIQGGNIVTLTQFFLTWPIIGLMAYFIKNKNFKRIWLVLLGVLSALYFDTMSSLLEAILMSPDITMFGKMFTLSYLRGWGIGGIPYPFYGVHIASNVITITFLVPVLVKLTNKFIKEKIVI